MDFYVFLKPYHRSAAVTDVNTEGLNLTGEHG